MITHVCSDQPPALGTAMAFFKNRAVNLFNLHFAVLSVALSGGGAFYAPFLIKSGLSIPLTLVAIGLVHGIRCLVRPAVVVFGARFGLRQTLLTGIFLTAAQYPLLAETT